MTASIKTNTPRPSESNAKILSYLPGLGRTNRELFRAARLLNLEYEQTHSERQMVRLAEHWSGLGAAALVVTTYQEIAVIRELLARTPKTAIVLLSSVGFQRLPYFLAVCPSIKCFLFSKTRTSGAESFLQILNQLKQHQPLPFGSLLGAHSRREIFSLETPDQKTAALSWATDFYNWALADTAEQGVQEKARQLCDTLDTLVTNALRHTKSGSPARASRCLPITIELGFDGSLLAQRVRDPAGQLERRRVVETLSTDERLNKRTTGFQALARSQHRIVLHLTRGQSTDITCVNRVSNRFNDHSMIPTSIEFYEWPGEERG